MATAETAGTDALDSGRLSCGSRRKPTRLSPEMLADLREAFALIDVDGGVTLSQQELSQPGRR